jgi:tRNA(Ile)-lysidine synthase
MFDKVLKFVEKEDLVRENDRIIAGISGGGDSVFLAYFLKFLQSRIKFSFVIAHFNHKLRENADLEEDFVRKLAEKLGKKFICQSSNVGQFACKHKMSVEMAARKLRYDFFGRLLKNEQYNKIAVAHNLTDSLETTLINFARGAGLRGLKGIDSYVNSIIRPLLVVDGSDIRNYLNKNNIEFVEDESNFTDCYLRNKVRKYLLPEFKNVFGDNVNNSLIKTSALLCETEKSISYLLENYLQDKIGYSDNCFRINKEKILSLPSYLIKEIIVYLVEKFNGSTYYLTANIVEGVSEFFRGSGYSIYTPSKRLAVTFVRSKKNLYLINKNFKNKSYFISSNKEYEIFPGVILRLTKGKEKEVKNSFSEYGFFLDNLDNLEVSPVIDGDYIEFNGKKRYNILSLMKKRGVGAFERKHFPVLKRGNEILAIPFVCIGDKLKKIQNKGNLIEVYIRDLIM